MWQFPQTDKLRLELKDLGTAGMQMFIQQHSTQQRYSIQAIREIVRQFKLGIKDME